MFIFGIDLYEVLIVEKNTTISGSLNVLWVMFFDLLVEMICLSIVMLLL